MTSEVLPVCRRADDVHRLSGRRVRLRGKYIEIDIYKRASPPRFEGRAGIELDGGALVLLEPSWSPAGIRAAEERCRLAGKTVGAIGILHEDPVEPPKPIAFIHYWCLSPVESVAALD